jgi:hypothetical protein
MPPPEHFDSWKCHSCTLGKRFNINSRGHAENDVYCSLYCIFHNHHNKIPPPPTHNYACIEINMTLTRFVVTADLQKADKVRF